MAKPPNSLPIGTQRPKKNGYWEIKAPHHPLAYSGNGRSGWVIRHRMMWYDHVQGEEQHCHYCGYGPLPWRGDWRTAINIDHINEIKGDDRIENLRPSCSWCNLLKSGWPLTYDEHLEAIQKWGHIKPERRPSALAVLVEAWGISYSDVYYNLSLQRTDEEGMF